MTGPAISYVHASGALLGEGASWDAAAQVLWWVDIKRGLLNRYSPQYETNESWPISEMLSCAIPLPGTGKLVAATRRDILKIDIGGVPDPGPMIASLSEFPDSVRFNDGKLDPAGHLWIGTMDNDELEACGRWLRYDLETGKRAEIASGFGVTNGPAFDVENNFVYVTDSANQRIYRGTFDRELGCVDLAPWRDFGPEHGYPDGMNFSPDGTLWVAFWDGSCIRQLDEAGGIVSEVPLPVQRPTSIAFASPTLAFVTSASIGLPEGGMDGALLSVCWP
jgi:sugar lactone lactonase YvrE